MQVALVYIGQKLLKCYLRFQDGSHDELSLHDLDLNDGLVRQENLLREQFRNPQGETVPPFPDADFYGCTFSGYLQRRNIGVGRTGKGMTDRIRFFRDGAEGIRRATAHRAWMRKGNFPLRSTAGQRNDQALSFTASAPRCSRKTAKKKGRAGAHPARRNIYAATNLRLRSSPLQDEQGEHARGEKPGGVGDRGGHYIFQASTHVARRPPPPALAAEKIRGR